MKKSLSLYELLQCNTNYVKEYVCSFADKKNKNSWLFLPASSLKIMLVAHIDTVYDVYEDKLEKKEIYYDSTKETWWSPCGLGADDRAGVYSVLELRRRTGCGIILCDKEEVGGVGAREAARIFKKIIKSLSVFGLIEMDRQGRDEMVYYSPPTLSFYNIIKKAGFVESVGSFSDVSILAPAWNIPAVNISVGYYHQHTRYEMLKEKEMRASIEKVYNILKNL